MKKLLFLGACLVALASQPVMAQTGGSTDVDVTVVRVTASYVRTHVTVTRPGARRKSLTLTMISKLKSGKKWALAISN
jgi:hypothetical protein